MSERAARRILIVEDDPECRLLMSGLLASSGFRVDAVGDGHMALSLLEATPPDLVLLDIHLPDANGYDVCRAIKSSAHSRDIPVVLLTAYTADEAREQGFAAGADEFVEKPYRAKELLSLIDQLLKIREATRQLDLGEAQIIEALRLGVDGGGSGK